jgi:hypothetical protein
LIVDVSRFLGVPLAQADRYITRKRGDEVKRGAIVAERRTGLGLQSKIARAPAAGTIIATGEGRVLIETSREPIELRAGIPGTVAHHIAGVGVVVETTGALIQGVWGTGGHDFGVMQVLTEERHERLRAEAVSVSNRGAMLVAGRGADAETLRRAAEFHVKGLVLGSLDPDLIDLARSLEYPLMITEGFGDQPMAAPTFTLLKTNTGREAALDARPADRMEGTRPELVIPLPAPAESPSLPAEGEALKVGKRVRALRAPYAGAVGSVARLLDTQTVLPSGVRAPAAQIELEDGGLAIIPFANLEILE